MEPGSSLQRSQTRLVYLRLPLIAAALLIAISAPVIGVGYGIFLLVEMQIIKTGRNAAVSWAIIHALAIVAGGSWLMVEAMASFHSDWYQSLRGGFALLGGCVMAYGIGCLIAALSYGSELSRQNEVSSPQE